MTSGRITVFLDRDGTINEEVGYLRSPEQLVLIPGAAETIRKFNDCGFGTCVISNQSGVARGMFPEEALAPIHSTLEEMLRLRGARIDRIFYCPHHPQEGVPPYNIACDCRKPLPGMLLRGARELGADLSRSFTIGDRIVDVQAGKAAGTTTMLVLTGYGKESVKECQAAGVVPDVIVSDLEEAATRIFTALSSRG